MIVRPEFGLLLLAIWAVGAAPAGAGEERALSTVPDLDLQRYAGRWYEIARYPNVFQRNCDRNVTATYAPLADGRISVVNACVKADGTTIRAEGVARRATREGPASQLEVRFAPAFLSFLPFVWGKYWVIDLAPDYTWAVIGDPGRKYLWVLGREPRMDEALLARIRASVQALGFDPGRLQKTRQDASPAP
jgi:apolipoprotein D and lipocalin family protein